MVLGYFTYPTSFESCEPLRVGIIFLIFQRRHLRLREDWGGPSPITEGVFKSWFTWQKAEDFCSQARKLDPSCSTQSRLCPSWGPSSCALWHCCLPGEPYPAMTPKTAGQGKPDPLTCFLSWVHLVIWGLLIKLTQEEGSRHQLEWKTPQGVGGEG